MTYLGHKYSSARDEVLHAMSLQGWANQSDGHVEAPTGYFALIETTEAELAEVVAAFAEAIESTEDSDFDPASLVGNFIVAENSQGFVDVLEVSDPGEARETYRELESEYAVWDQS